MKPVLPSWSAKVAAKAVLAWGWKFKPVPGPVPKPVVGAASALKYD
jgi:hypothetical protein